MQVQEDIAFDQLLKAVRNLPAVKLKQLKAEIEKGDKNDKSKIDLEALLLKGPTATKKQLAIIEINRKSINQCTLLLSSKGIISKKNKKGLFLLKETIPYYLNTI